MKAITMIRALILVPFLVQAVCAASPQRVYEVWENEPASNRGPDFEKPSVGNGTPFDKDREQWSHPIGNGYMGANLFGRVDTERIQITEKTLHNKGIYNGGGLTSFAEVYLDFSHREVGNYRRSLNHQQYIEILPALPKAWSTGSFAGLVARGNFVISATWKDGKPGSISITSRSGGECRIAYPGIESVQVKDSSGKIIKTTSDRKGRMKFTSTKGEAYTFAF